VEKAGWDVESWTEPGDYAELKSDFAGWHSDIHQLIDNADRDSLFKWALYDRPPMRHWGQGRVTLLGDACHPTLPFMAQGAAMAIEDAAVIAGCLASNDDTAASLQHYEALRRGRTASIQNGSRRNATVFHLSGIKAWLRNRAARSAGNHTMDKLYRYNALEATHV
jgi:salicylate hydroxylase